MENDARLKIPSAFQFLFGFAWEIPLSLSSGIELKIGILPNISGCFLMRGPLLRYASHIILMELILMELMELILMELEICHTVIIYSVV